MSTDIIRTAQTRQPADQRLPRIAARGAAHPAPRGACRRRSYQAGERFTTLHVLNSGMVKIVNLSPDGREQVVGLHFRGDWLGFDGIASGHYGCDAVAMDTGEVWSFRYDALLEPAPPAACCRCCTRR